MDKSPPKRAAPAKYPPKEVKQPKGFLNSFKIKNPVSHFKEVFKKEVDQQWLIAKASFLQFVIQGANLLFLSLTQSSLKIRMEFEENEYRRALWASIFHVVAWVFLCYLRRKHFTIPKIFGILTLNIFCLSFFYLQSYMLCANTLGDPNSKILFQSFLVSDCFFSFVYILMGDYIFPSFHFWWCQFPKFFFAVSFFFYFDDRLGQILQAYIATAVVNFFVGLTAEELLGDCYHEEITEFGVLDHYTLLYLDLPYILRKSYEGLADNLSLLRDRLFKPKVSGDYLAAAEEEEKADDKQKKE